MRNFLAERMQRLGTETAFNILAKAKALEAQGKEITHMEIGEPDFDTPSNIIEAGVKALRSGYTHYTPANGILEVRQAIAKYTSQQRGVEYEADEVVIVPGGKPIMFFLIMAVVNPGDEVICPNPGFPIYESVVSFVGGKPVPIPLKEEFGFSLDVEELKKLITPKTKMIIVNSPQNPTGGVIPFKDLQVIAQLAKEHDLLVLSDEIYSRLAYDEEVHSIVEIPGMKERTVILDGFSKTYAMTGWRLGYGVMNKELAEQITKLMINCNSCTNAATQMAGLEAVTGPQDSVDMMVAEFKRRRDYIVDGLNSIPGFSCIRPQGAFYAFPNIKKTGMTSDEMADFLLNKAGVACLSGTAFGQYGEGYLRFSYATSIENIDKALTKIRKAMSER